MEIDSAALREIQSTRTGIYYFTEHARFISIVFRLYF